MRLAPLPRRDENARGARTSQDREGGLDVERESMEFDVVIVGAGPSGLSTAIRLRQLCAEHGSDLSVCIVEKGSEVGAHILSGAVLEPRSLEELFPDWKERGAPLHTPAREDRFLFLTRGGAVRLPTPPQMHNAGNYIISLGNLCRWLGEQAEALDVSIFPGFPAAEVLYHEDGSVRGGGDPGHGDRARRAAERELRAGGGAARAGHRLRRGLPRPPDQGAVRALRSPRRRRPADLRHRHQGAVGDRAGPARAGADRAHPRMAARPLDLRRLVPLPPRRPPGRGGVRRRPRLRQSASRPLR